MNWTRRAPIGVIAIVLGRALVYGFWPVAYPRRCRPGRARDDQCGDRG